MEEFTFKENTLNVEDYKMLREAVGWGNLDNEATEIGIKNSLITIAVYHNESIVGCGRLIGDGGIYFYLQDIIVLPKYQRKGIGKQITNKLMNYISLNAHPNAIIGLLAAQGVKDFYKKYGFIERSPDRPGMVQKWKGR